MRSSSQPFDFEFLRSTFVEFREKMGSRAWMLDTARRDQLLGALLFAYARTRLTPDQEMLAQQWCEATVEEFSWRCLYVDLMPKEFTCRPT